MQDKIVTGQNGEYHFTIWSCILHCLCSTIFYQSLFAISHYIHVHTVHVKVCDCDNPALRLWAENSFVSGFCTCSLSKPLTADNHRTTVFTHSPPPSCRSLPVHFKLFQQVRKGHLIIYQECCTIYALKDFQWYSIGKQFSLETSA